MMATEKTRSRTKNKPKINLIIKIGNANTSKKKPHNKDITLCTCRHANKSVFPWCIRKKSWSVETTKYYLMHTALREKL